MRNVLTAPVGIAVFLVASTALLTPGDARRGGGGVEVGGGGPVHVGRMNRNGSANRQVNTSVTRKVDTNRSISRNANVDRNVDLNRSAGGSIIVKRNADRTADRNVNYVYRNDQRGYLRNGVWIAAPAVAGASNGYVASSCAYQYRKWQATGSPYWRSLYKACANVTHEPPPN